MLQLNPQNRAGTRQIGAPPEHPSPEPVEYILSDKPEDAPTTTGGTSSRAMLGWPDPQAGPQQCCTPGKHDVWSRYNREK